MQKSKIDGLADEKQPINPLLWVENYADYLYFFAYSKTHNEDLARELIQETFLSALEKANKFEGRSSERTWLTSILKNKIIDIYRKKSHLQKENEGEGGNYYNDIFFNSDDGHWKTEHQPMQFGIEEYDPIARKELNHILQKCIQKLPDLWLSVFTMKHIDEERTDKICRDLQISPSNFWVIIHRSKVNLRSCLQKNWI